MEDEAELRLLQAKKTPHEAGVLSIALKRPGICRLRFSHTLWLVYPSQIEYLDLNIVGESLHRPCHLQ